MRHLLNVEHNEEVTEALVDVRGDLVEFSFNEELLVISKKDIQELADLI